MSRTQKGGGIGPRLSVLFGFFVIMLVFVSFCQPFINELPIGEREKLLAVSSVQSFFAFIVPAYIMARVSSPSPFRLLGLAQGFSWKAIAGIVILFIIGLPFLNQIVYWNESLSLPASMKGMEEVFRNMEERAEATTDLLLHTYTVGGLLSGILIVGCLTGLSEEILFRGALQKTFGEGGWKPSVAIWVAAAVFSFMHFQFFGFVPRILLGALFGYLLVWTGSLWPSVFAHALNNSIVVVTVWIENKNFISGNAGDFGVVTDSFPWPFMVSLVFLSIFFYCFRSTFFFNTSCSSQGKYNLA